MGSATHPFRASTLRGFRPSIVRTSRDAFALSERLFSRLDHFEFATEVETRLVSSGLRDADGSSIRLVSSTGHRISLRDDDKVALLFPYSGSIAISHGSLTETARTSEMIVAWPGHREAHLSRHYLGGLIQIPLCQAEKIREVLGKAPERTVYRVSTLHVVAEAHLLIEALERGVAPLGVPGRMASAIGSLWEAVALSVCGMNAAVSPPASLQQVQRAESYMAANATRHLTVAEIAAVADVGPRSLQLGFWRHRRYSPLQFLQEHRLRLARSRLIRATTSETVTQIALDCGFTHLGRFSEAYRAAFGEHPSRSLRRRR